MSGPTLERVELVGGAACGALPVVIPGQMVVTIVAAGHRWAYTASTRRTTDHGRRIFEARAAVPITTPHPAAQGGGE